MRHFRDNLLVKFSVVSFIILAVVAVIIITTLSSIFRSNAVDDLIAEAVGDTSHHILTAITPADLQVPMTGERYEKFHQFIQRSIVSERTAQVKLWSKDSTVIYSDDRAGIGERFPDKENLIKALAGENVTEINVPTDADNAREQHLGTLMEVYVPIVFPGDPQPQGVFEIYKYYAPVAAQINDMRLWVLVTVVGGLFALYAGLVSIVGGGWRTITGQRMQLESVNAELAGRVIEARDSNEQLKIEISERRRAEEAVRGGEADARRLAHESASMAEIGRIISSSLNIDEVYESFVQEVSKLLSFDRISISIIDANQGTYKVAYHVGPEVPGRQKGDVGSLEGSFTESVARTPAGINLFLEDLTDIEIQYPGLVPLYKAGMRSSLGVPLVCGNVVTVVLILNSTKLRAYDDHSLELARRVGAQIAGAIANSELHSAQMRADKALRGSEADARRLAHENAAMAEIGRIISSSLDIDEVYERFVREVNKLLAADRISVNIINSYRSTYRIAYAIGPEIPGRQKGDVIPLAGSFTESVARSPSGINLPVEDMADIAAQYPGSIPLYETGMKSSLGVPLISEDMVIGILILNSIKPSAYDDHALELVCRVGTQIAGAIANSELHAAQIQADEALQVAHDELELRVEERTTALKRSNEETRQLARESAAMAEISRIISSSLDISEVTETFAEQLSKVIPFDRAVINVVVPGQSSLNNIFFTGVEVKDRNVGEIISQTGTQAEAVIHARTSLLIQTEDRDELVSKFPGLEGNFDAGMRSFLCVPLVSDGRIIATLNLRSKKVNAYSQHDLALTERVAGQIAGAIASTELYTTIQREAQEREVLADVSRIISSSLDIEDVFDNFAQLVAQSIPADRIALNVITPNGDDIAVNLCAWGQEMPEFGQGISRPGGGFTAEAIKTRRSIIDNHHKVHRVDSISTEIGSRSLLVVPLIFENEPIGVLHFSTTQERAYADRHIAFAESVATQIAGAIASCRLHTELSLEAEKREVLIEIGRILGSSLDISTIFRRFADEIAQVIPFDSISVSLTDVSKGIVTHPYVLGVPDPCCEPGDMTPLKGSVTEQLVQLRNGLIVGGHDWEHIKALFPSLDTRNQNGLVSLLTVPLISRDKVLGTLSFRSRLSDAYTQEDLLLVRQVASHLSSAIVNSQLYFEQLETEEALRKSEVEAYALARHQEVMANIGKVISSSLDIDEVYQEFALEVQKLIHFDTLHISMVDLEKQTTTVSYVSRINNIHDPEIGDVVQFAGSMAGEIIETGDGIIIQDVSQEWISVNTSASVRLPNARMGSFLGVPLVHNNQIKAVLQIKTARANAYTDEDLALAKMVAEQITGTIANAELYAQLKESQEAQGRLTTMMNATTDLVGIANSEGRVIYMNQAGRDLLGITHDDQVLNVPFTTFHPSWANATIQSEGKPAAILSGAWEAESAFLSRQGDEIPVSMVLLSHKSDDGEVEFLSTISRDISAIKRVNDELQRAKETAEAASSAKSEFLANMSHEIRTPLNAISGFTQLMGHDTKFPDKHRNYLNMVSQSAGSLSQIINDILDFSKIEAGKLEFENTQFDLQNLVDKTIAMFSLGATTKGLKLGTTIADGVDTCLVGDSGRLGQVLVNLIGNAIKFTEQGSISLDIQTDSNSRTGICLHFTVADTGIGIPKDRQETIFDAFSQADSSTTRNYGGTGLGLAIACQIIEQMDGRIWVESQIGLGSEFHFTARFATANNAHSTATPVEPSADPHEVEDEASGQGGTLKVLLAEDNDLNQILATEILEMNGYEVVVADDGKRALQLLEQESFDLVLMDIHMPVLDGFQATKAIRKSESSTGAHIPIIAMTANAMDGDEQKCYEAGMDGYVAKPMSTHDMVDAIKKVLSLN